MTSKDPLFLQPDSDNKGPVPLGRHGRKPRLVLETSSASMATVMKTGTYRTGLHKGAQLGGREPDNGPENEGGQRVN